MVLAGLIITIVSILVTVITIWMARHVFKEFFQSISPYPSIAIFGPKDVGKTTLICYLQRKPLPLQHYETFGAMSVGKITYDLSGNKSYYFRSLTMYDVGGEFTNQWNAIIKKQNPDGIIFIADTSDQIIEMERFNKIFSFYHDWCTDELAINIKLRAILILINKADLWGTTSAVKERTIKKYKEDILANSINMFKNEFPNIVFQFEWSSLILEDFQSHNNEILRSFAKVLDKKEK
jgi:signal recognition particle receptor subunit beta